MKRIISTFLATLLIMILSVNAFAIKIDFSFKTYPDELTSEEYIYSFGRTETDEALKEIGFKINGERYVLSEPSLYTANKTGVFGVGFRDENNLLGDSYDITPYYITEENEEVEGEVFTINKNDYIDNDAGIKLSSIQVDGKELSYFNENVKSYEYGIPYEDMEVNNPLVTATPKDANSEVAYNLLPTGVEITVTSEDKRTEKYTVNFKPVSEEKHTAAASKMGTKRRDSDREITSIASDAYTTAIRNTSVNQDADATNPNRFGQIPYITFDIPENINCEDEVIFEIRVRTLNTVPRDLKIYAYEYNEDAMPYFKNEAYDDYGYLGKVLNPEGWSAYSEVNQVYQSYSCDISSYIAKLVALGKTEAKIAVYFDSDKITEYWKGYHAGTYTYPTDLSINLVTNTEVVKNTTAEAYKGGYPKITYTELKEYEPKNLALLSAINVNGTAISYFNEEIYTYNIAVADSEDLPVISATAKSEDVTATVTDLGNGAKIDVVHKNGSASVYYVNYCTAESDNKYPVYQGVKQIQNENFVETSLTGTSLATLETRSFFSGISNASNKISMFKFNTGSDVIDYEKGVKFSVVIKANFDRFSGDVKLHAYEYDAENKVKYDGENDLSNRGKIVDTLTMAEGTVVAGNASYKKFVFDITDYVIQAKAEGKNEISIILGHDSLQMNEIRAAYKAGTYGYSDIATSPYAYNTAIIAYRGANNVFDGAEPTLSYDVLTPVKAPDRAVITAIKIGNDELAGFNPEIYTYNIGVESIENIPEVTAVAKFEGTTVTVSGEGTQKTITVKNGDYTKVYTINFALLESVSKTTAYQASKQIQNTEDKYVAVALDDEALKTLQVRVNANSTSSLSSQQTLMEFNLGEDTIDTSKGVYLKIRAKSNAAKFPQELKLCAYEYDSLNTLKRNGTYDLSFMGALVDSVEISEGVVHPANASYYDYTFDISSYVAKIQASGAETFKLILGFDYEQIQEYREMYTAGEYTAELTDFAFTVYPNSKSISNYTGSGGVFDGAAPLLTYKRIVK